MFYSQAGQDEWIAKKTNYKRDGFFIDIGAFDGIKYSNSYHLEKILGWKGICIEADPKNFEQLIKNRVCICEKIAVNNTKGRIKYSSLEMGGKIDSRGTIEVDSDTLENILDRNNCPLNIDYLSIDIEGNEFNALEFFPFDKYVIKYITIEHNLYSQGDFYKLKIKNLLEKNGYVIDVENVKHEGLEFEDWYKKI